MLDFSVYSIDTLSAATLYNALQLRSEVFVIEQQCIYQDLDGKDTLPDTLHILGVDPKSANLVAYARCLAPGISYKSSSIGRVVIAPSHRGLGLAQVLMNQAITECVNRWPKSNIEIGAQHHLLAFYQSLGFTETSEPFDEDGIMHIDMERVSPS